MYASVVYLGRKYIAKNSGLIAKALAISPSPRVLAWCASMAKELLHLTCSSLFHLNTP